MPARMMSQALGSGAPGLRLKRYLAKRTPACFGAPVGNLSQNAASGSHLPSGPQPRGVFPCPRGRRVAAGCLSFCGKRPFTSHRTFLRHARLAALFDSAPPHRNSPLRAAARSLLSKPPAILWRFSLNGGNLCCDARACLRQEPGNKCDSIHAMREIGAKQSDLDPLRQSCRHAGDG